MRRGPRISGALQPIDREFADLRMLEALKLMRRVKRKPDDRRVFPANPSHDLFFTLC
jgi:hypothetical protein